MIALACKVKKYKLICTPVMKGVVQSENILLGTAVTGEQRSSRFIIQKTEYLVKERRVGSIILESRYRNKKRAVALIKAMAHHGVILRFYATVFPKEGFSTD